jgi:transcriptional regulator with XRE-family HTH domain
MSREAILKENFASQLTSLRKARYMSQEELVNALKEASNHEIDITRSALASYENQKSLPRLDVFNAIARFFDTSMDTMLETGTGAPKRPEQPSGADMDELFTTLNLKLSELQRQRDYYQRECEYYKSEYEKAIRRSDKPADPTKEESRADFLRRMYNYPYWQEQFRALLDDVEFVVFYGVQNNQTKAQLAERLALDPAEVENIFNRAKEKVLDYFSK